VFKICQREDKTIVKRLYSISENQELTELT